MITDRQVRRLRMLLIRGETLSRAAWRTGMDRKTARTHRSRPLPSETEREHAWRTREDPFHEVWGEVFEQLEVQPGLKAKTLFQWLQRNHPGRFQDGQLRTFQRGVKQWRATHGPHKEVFFSQVHKPGRLCASDFTFMNDLQVTIERVNVRVHAEHLEVWYAQRCVERLPRLRGARQHYVSRQVQRVQRQLQLYSLPQI